MGCGTSSMLSTNLSKSKKKKKLKGLKLPATAEQPSAKIHKQPLITIPPEHDNEGSSSSSQPSLSYQKGITGAMGEVKLSTSNQECLS
jgi:hypothetical protein